MSDIFMFDIDGAISMSEAKFYRRMLELPKEMNKNYRFGAFKDGFLLASVDGKNYSIALAVEIDGVEISAKDFRIKE